MYFEIMEHHEGEEISYGSKSITVHLEPSDDSHDIVIEEPGSGESDKHCKISGDTYPAKDDIKEIGYGNKGAEWTGEYWQCHHSRTADLATILMVRFHDVAIDAMAVAHCEGWGPLREGIEIDDSGEETYTVMQGPEGDDNHVSRSWAEDAADVGNYSSAEEFADEFGLEIVSDQQIKEEKGLTEDDDELVVSSDDAF